MFKKLISGFATLAAVFYLNVSVNAEDSDQIFKTRVNEINNNVKRVDYLIQNFSSITDKFNMLSRQADRQDRQQVKDAVEKLQNDITDLSSRLENNKADEAQISNDYSSGKCNQCLTRIENVLERVRNLKERAQNITQKMVSLEKETKARVVTSKKSEKAVNLTDMALTRATRMAGKTGEGQNAFPGLRRAFELQEKAKEALVAGHMEQALDLTIRARDVIGVTLQMALDSSDVALIKEHAQQYYERTENMIKKISGEINPDKNPNAAKLVTEAQNQLDKAKEARDAGEPYKALQFASRAREIVDQIARFQHQVETIDQRIPNIQSKIDRATGIVEDANNAKATEVLDKGVDHFNKGKDLYDAGKDKEATVELDVAVKLVAKSVDIVKGTGTVNGVDIGMEIKKTEIIIKKASELASTDQQKDNVEKAKTLVTQAREKTSTPEVCLKLLDQATNEAFAVIAQAKKDNQSE